MTRTSHALAADGKVWLVDALDWPEAIERALALGEPAGVVQLLDRHDRDCAALASRLGVPHVVAPDEIPGSPFACIPVMRRKRWRESALWRLDDADARHGRRARDEPVLHRRQGAGRRAPPPSAHAAECARRRSSRSTCSSATARECTAPLRPTPSATRCERAAAGSRASSYACRSPAAARRSPGRTRRGGATSPASFTGGLSGSASGAAPNDARTRSSGGTPVERRPLARDAAGRADELLHALGRHLLPELGSGGARDRLVHERPAEVVHAGGERLPRPSGPSFTQEAWMFVISRMEREPRDRVHEQRLAERRPAARAALEVDRRLHRHERQRHELGEAARPPLLLARAQEVARPAPRRVGVAEHQRHVRAQADAMRRVVHGEPLRGRHLVGADHAPHLVVEHLGGRPGQRAEPEVARAARGSRRARARASRRPARPRAPRTRARGSPGRRP